MVSERSPQAFRQVTFKLPASWTVRQLLMVGPADSAAEVPTTADDTAVFQPNIIMMSEPLETDERLQSYYERQLRELDRLGVLRRTTTALETVSLSDGAPALLAEHVLVDGAGVAIRQLQLTIVKHALAYTLTASHRDGPEFDRHRSQLRAQLLSFSIP